MDKRFYRCAGLRVLKAGVGLEWDAWEERTGGSRMWMDVGDEGEALLLWVSGGGEAVVWNEGEGRGKTGCCFGGLVAFESEWR